MSIFDSSIPDESYPKTIISFFKFWTRCTLFESAYPTLNNDESLIMLLSKSDQNGLFGEYIFHLRTEDLLWDEIEDFKAIQLALI